MALNGIEKTKGRISFERVLENSVKAKCKVIFSPVDNHRGTGLVERLIRTIESN